MGKGFEFDAVEQVQPIFGTNPHVPVTVLIDVVDMAVGKLVVRAEKFIGIGSGYNNIKKKAYKTIYPFIFFCYHDTGVVMLYLR